MLSDLNMWNKIGRIIALAARERQISVAEAADLFYRSRTCTELHDPETGLYLMGDKYILDNLLMEN